MKKFLHRKNLDLFLDVLRSFGELHGPVLTEDGVYAFRPIQSPAELRLDYQRTLIPPKKYLLPPRQATLTFSPAEGYQQLSSNQGPMVLFGVHSCDLAGIAYLDKVFLGIVNDPWYGELRGKLTLVGLSCQPDPACFCNETTIARPQNFDLFLENIGEGFILTQGTEKGDTLLERSQTLITGLPRGTKRQRQQKPLPPTAPPARVAEGEFPESPLWEEFADRCFSCGACSACCPTCYCYDVIERGNLDGATATRVRSWDNCLFKSHGEVAGGVNFRSTRLDRLRYRFLHKYRGFGPLRNVPSCVGCGRCGAVCPVGIDLLDLFREERIQRAPI